MTTGIEEPLWPNGTPGALGTEELDVPTLTRWLPEEGAANGAAVVILPGGGYGGLATGHEGEQIAAWLTGRGFAAWMLKYRLGTRYPHPTPLQDAARAMRTVRTLAAQSGVDRGRIGIWGFSAGGHLASTLSTHWDDGDTASTDPVEQASSRPDFAILCYPVITMRDDYTHSGSKQNLLGENPTPELVELLSNEGQVNEQTPPTFIFQTDEDTAVPAENAVQYYLALRRAKVPAELHIYETGVHGVGLAQSDPILSTWPQRLEDWFRVRKIIQ